MTTNLLVCCVSLGIGAFLSSHMHECECSKLTNVQLELLGRSVSEIGLREGREPRPVVALDEEGDSITIPSEYIRDFLGYNVRIGVDLVPSTLLLKQLGLGKKISPIKRAFRTFGDSVAQAELQNAKLVSGDEGDYIEIAPFDSAQQPLEVLGTKLGQVIGDNDWRVDLLLAVTEKSNNGGYGKYRQEIFLKEEKDTGGSPFDMIKRIDYDADGNRVGSGGFSVRNGQKPVRYAELFDAVLKMMDEDDNGSH